MPISAQDAFTMAGATTRFLHALLSETNGRFPFPRGDYVPPKPTRAHIRCAKELSETLRLTASSGIDPLRLAIIDAAFAFAGIDKKQHLEFLSREILAPAVAQIFTDAHDQGKSRVGREALTAMVKTLKHGAPDEDTINRKDVADILNKALARDMFAVSAVKGTTAITPTTDREKPKLVLV